MKTIGMAVSHKHNLLTNWQFYSQSSISVICSVPWHRLMDYIRCGFSYPVPDRVTVEWPGSLGKADWPLRPIFFWVCRQSCLIAPDNNCFVLRQTWHLTPTHPGVIVWCLSTSFVSMSFVQRDHWGIWLRFIKSIQSQLSK